MEKRKTLGLQGYFQRSLFLAVVGTVLIILVWLVLFVVSLQTGIIAPANAGEIEAQTEIEKVRGTGSFDPGFDPRYSDFIYFGADGRIEESSLSDDALTREAEAYHDTSASYTDARYVFLDDGSYYLFTWSYTVRFTSDLLREAVPNLETVGALLMILSLIVFYLVLARRMTGKLTSRLTLMETASEQIAHRDLDGPIVTSTGIREFDQALRSMEGMREALKGSLMREWESEHQRKEQIAALAHDIKTPLTIINGNAELLLEEPLTVGQRNLVQSIHNAGTRTRRYVVALQQVSRFDVVENERELCSVEDLTQATLSSISPLARAKGISLDVDADGAAQPICVYPFVLACALTNIGENAVRHTPEDGHITISVAQTESTTAFVFDDEGPGFSEEAIRHASEMFWQQDKSRTDGGSDGSTGGNYGMGLAIAAKAADLHQGSLTLGNTGKGGRVRLTIGTA